MPPGGADLFFNQMEVVQQPFPGWRNPVLVRHCRGQQGAHLHQSVLVVVQPAQQRVVWTPWRQPVHPGQRRAVLRHLLGAEQFRAQRRGLVGRALCPAASLKPSLRLEITTGKPGASVQ